MTDDKKECCGKICCPVTGINIPRFLLASVIGFIFVFGYDYLVHHVLLMETYETTADLWRAPETMEQFFPYMLGYQALYVIFLGFIFTRNFEGKGIMEGVRFGIALGLLLALCNAAAYIWMPIPLNLALAWGGCAIGSAIGIGVIFALLYKK